MEAGPIQGLEGWEGSGGLAALHVQEHHLGFLDQEPGHLRVAGASFLLPI